jgi:hypothetical protein
LPAGALRDIAEIDDYAEVLQVWSECDRDLASRRT